MKLQYFTLFFFLKLYLCSNSLSEEKRRIEGRISSLEEDLEEEQMNSEAAQEKARKAQQQADSMQTELSQLQSNLSKADSAKSQLEKQVSGNWKQERRREEGR